MSNEKSRMPENAEQQSAEQPEIPRGVENPEIIDLIRRDPASGEVDLVVLEQRRWGSDPQQLAQFDEKLNRYLTYVLNGFLARQYPQYEGMPTRIVIDCAEPPEGQDVLRFFAGVERVCEANGVGFAIRAGGPRGPGTDDSAADRSGMPEEQG